MKEQTTIHILLLEDDTELAEYISELLTGSDNLDCQVMHIFNTHELPSIVGKGIVDVILINLNLLNANNLNALEQLNNNFPNTPVIVILNKENITLYSQFIKPGIKCFLIKQKADDLLLVKFIYLVIERLNLELAINELYTQKNNAVHDNLTGLPNKLYMSKSINQIMRYKQNSQPVFALAYIDLDNFEYINYTFSHAYGDEVLKVIANKLATSISDTDVIARVGPDEFIVLLTNIVNEEEAQSTCIKLQDKITEPIVIDEKQCLLTATIGITLYPQDGNNADKLMQNAEIVMHLLKKHNMGGCKVFKNIVNINDSKNIKLINDIKTALKCNEFLLYFQPQVDFETKKIVGVEVLLRWQHRILGLLTPFKFLSFSNNFGFTILLDNFVVKESCRWYSKLPKKIQKQLKLTINISTEQLLNEVFADNIINVINKFKLNSRNIELEINEQAFEDSIEYANRASLTTSVGIEKIEQTIRQLKNFGFSITINDFGNSYSSMNYLESLAIDKIKINSTYIEHLTYNYNATNSIKCILTIAKNLDLDLVAVGVENKEQAELLFELGCNCMQGEYFFKAMSSEEVIQLINDNLLFPGKH